MRASAQLRTCWCGRYYSKWSRIRQGGPRVTALTRSVTALLLFVVSPPESRRHSCGGDDGTRTHDPLLAKQPKRLASSLVRPQKPRSRPGSRIGQYRPVPARSHAFAEFSRSAGGVDHDCSSSGSRCSSSSAASLVRCGTATGVRGAVSALSRQLTAFRHGGEGHQVSAARPHRARRSRGGAPR